MVEAYYDHTIPRTFGEKMKRHYRKYSDEDIINNAKNVKSISELLKSLGLKEAGGNYNNIKINLSRLNVDTSHWTGQAWNKNEKLKDWHQYKRPNHLKKHLLIERGHKCEKCNNSEWFGTKIAIELHHIDGNRNNNNSENLQLLCPNCHSLTDNWRGRKPKEKNI